MIQIGIQIIQRLQVLHELGFLHMDLKPDNIVLGTHNMNSEDSSLIYLIDFGISKTYQDSYAQHIPLIQNIIF